MRAAELEWMTDLPKALAQAKKENKMVLMNFTISGTYSDTRVRASGGSTPSVAMSFRNSASYLRDSSTNGMPASLDLHDRESDNGVVDVSGAACAHQ